MRTPKITRGSSPTQEDLRLYSDNIRTAVRMDWESVKGRASNLLVDRGLKDAQLGCLCNI